MLAFSLEYVTFSVSCAFFLMCNLNTFAYPGPFDSALSIDFVLEQIAEHRSQLKMLKDEQNAIIQGLAFFKMEQPLSRSLRMLEKVWSSAKLEIMLLSHLMCTPTQSRGLYCGSCSWLDGQTFFFNFLLIYLFFVVLCAAQDIDKLQQVWEIAKEWNSTWNNWKVGHLTTLETEGMEITAQEMLKKLHVLQRDLKVSCAIWRCVKIMLSATLRNTVWWYTSLLLV